MKVNTPDGARIRCDSCARLEDVSKLTKDRRPPASSRDRWFDFVIPPSKLDPLTKKPAKGHFRGIASASEPGKLAALNACPGCAPKIQKAFAKKDPSLLPDGPLKVLMREVQMKYELKGLRIN